MSFDNKAFLFLPTEVQNFIVGDFTLGASAYRLLFVSTWTIEVRDKTNMHFCVPSVIKIVSRLKNL